MEGSSGGSVVRCWSPLQEIRGVGVTERRLKPCYDEPRREGLAQGIPYASSPRESLIGSGRKQGIDVGGDRDEGGVVAHPWHEWGRVAYLRRMLRFLLSVQTRDYARRQDVPGDVQPVGWETAVERRCERRAIAIDFIPVSRRSEFAEVQSSVGGSQGIDGPDDLCETTAHRNSGL